jgi:hypothetical protein
VEAPVPQQREPSPVETSLQQREPPPVQREPLPPHVRFSPPAKSPVLPQRENHRLIDELTPSSPRRSTRQRQVPKRLGYDGSQGSGFTSETALSLISVPFGLPDHAGNTDAKDDAFYSEAHTFQPHAFVAHKDPDTLSWSEAMADTDQDKWVAAA